MAIHRIRDKFPYLNREAMKGEAVRRNKLRFFKCHRFINTSRLCAIISLLHLIRNKVVLTYFNLIIVTIILSALSSCNSIERWGEVVIDPKLSRASIYKELDGQKEIFSAFEKWDPSISRSSDVAYYSGHEKLDSQHAKFNNCRAFYFSKLHSDTLLINIGIGNGFGGHGFIIKYRKGKFYTEPYVSTDVVYEDMVEPVYKVIYQKLTLDKSGYEVGDSLFGRIDFKSIEKDGLKTKEDVGKGYFRTQVTKL